MCVDSIERNSAVFLAYLLIVLGFLGFLMLAVGRTTLTRRFGDLSSKEVFQAHRDALLGNREDPNLLVNVFALLVFDVVSLTYAFVIEPLTVLYAVMHHVGDGRIGNLVMVVILTFWLRSIRGLRQDQSNIPMNQMKEPNMANKVYFGIPLLYMWYIAAVLVLGS